MHHLRMTAPAAWLLAAWLAGGCAASGSPGYDARFGDAARELRAQQLIDADAAKRHAGKTPPADGRTLREALDRHVSTYREPPAAPSITIGVGSAAGGG
jgi:hypothetical protein